MVAEIPRRMLKSREDTSEEALHSTFVPSADGGVADGLATAAASVVCSFLAVEYKSAREAVHKLLDVAANACAGRVQFFSAPGGRGRKALIGASSASQPTGFVLVASSGKLACGEKSSLPQRHELLQAALNQGFAGAGCAAAAVVRGPRGVDGILLVEQGPGACASASPAAPAALGLHTPIRLVVALWAAVLAERLERIQQVIEQRGLVASLTNVSAVMRKLNDQDLHRNEALDEASKLLPDELLLRGCTANRAAIWLVDSEAGELILNDTGRLDGVRMPRSAAIAGDAAAAQGSVLGVPDVSSHPNNNAALDEVTGIRRQGTICIPVVSAEVPLHVMEWVYKPNCQQMFDHFDLTAAEDQRTNAIVPMMFVLRESILTAFENERRRHCAKALSPSFTAAKSVTELTEALEVQMAEIMDAEVCTFFFIDDTRNEIWAPQTPQHPNGIRNGVGEGFVGYVAQKARVAKSAEILTINDPASNPLWKGDVEQGFTTRNIMTVPVFASVPTTCGRLLGIIQVLNKRAMVCGQAHGLKKPGFSRSDEHLAMQLAEDIGSHLHRLLAELMWTKARMDLTGQKDLDGSESTEQAMSMMTEYYKVHNGSGDEKRLPAMATENSLKQLQCRSEELCKTLATESGKLSVPRCRLDLRGWRMDYWDMSQEDQFHLMHEALTDCDQTSKILVPLSCTWNFLLAIRNTYRKLPYHNFQHAMSTVHYTYKFIHAPNLARHMSELDMFAVLVAALGHDCDHRGFNNAFEVMSRSELSLRYNDASPLENHHCAKLFETALGGVTAEKNIFIGLDTTSYDKVRQHIVAAILATDMQHHGEHVRKVQQFELTEGITKEQSRFLAEFLLHAADISNPMMPQDISAKWNRRIAEEFTLQVEEERKLGLPVTKFMDGLTDRVAASKSSLGFISFVVAPMVEPMLRKFQNLEPISEMLELNREALEDEVKNAAILEVIK